MPTVTKSPFQCAASHILMHWNELMIANQNTCIWPISTPWGGTLLPKCYPPAYPLTSDLHPKWSITHYQFYTPYSCNTSYFVSLIGANCAATTQNKPVNFNSHMGEKKKKKKAFGEKY